MQAILDRVKAVWRGKTDSPSYQPFYASLVRSSRHVTWYEVCAIADTLDSRFDVLSCHIALALLRLEELEEAGRLAAARLTEVFVTDMKDQARQIGIGDIIVGKYMGKMMSALGGRLEAFRTQAHEEAGLRAALVRILYHHAAPDAAALAACSTRMQAVRAALAAASLEELMAGAL